MHNHTKNWGRRDFIHALGATAVASSLPFQGIANTQHTGNMTVQQVIDMIIKTIPNAPFKETVDTLKSGSPDQVVTGIVTTMFATVDVIRQAAATGANFIIAHEPTFYNHFDDTSWLENDPVYQYKSSLLQQHKIAVWRFHDYIHAHQPDGVMAGVLAALGWEKYTNPQQKFILDIPSTSLEKIIGLAKQKLHIEHLRYIGDKKMNCKKIALIPGAAPGKMQMTILKNEKPDLLIIGELEEWETSEYIRDLRSSGSSTSLLVLGHIVSEEPGLAWLEKWLQPQVPGIRVQHIPSLDAFSWA